MARMCRRLSNLAASMMGNVQPRKGWRATAERIRPDGMRPGRTIAGTNRRYAGASPTRSNDEGAPRSGLPVGLSAHFAMSTVRASMLSHQRQLNSIEPFLVRMGTKAWPQPVQLVIRAMRSSKANSGTHLSFSKLARALCRRASTLAGGRARSRDRRYSNPS